MPRRERVENSWFEWNICGCFCKLKCVKKLVIEIVFSTDLRCIFSMCDTFLWRKNEGVLSVAFVRFLSSSAVNWPPHVAGILLYICYLMVYCETYSPASCLLMNHISHTLCVRQAAVITAKKDAEPNKGLFHQKCTGFFWKESLWKCLGGLFSHLPVNLGSFTVRALLFRFISSVSSTALRCKMGTTRREERRNMAIDIASSLQRAEEVLLWQPKPSSSDHHSLCSLVTWGSWLPFLGDFLCLFKSNIKIIVTI